MRHGVLAMVMALNLAVPGDGLAQPQRPSPVRPAEVHDGNSANYLMVGCRAFVARSTNDPFRQGLCMGRVAATMALVSCAPEQVTYGQAVRVVIQYIDERPARLHEDFLVLAREAFNLAWPCRR